MVSRDDIGSGRSIPIKQVSCRYFGAFLCMFSRLNERFFLHLNNLFLYFRTNKCLLEQSSVYNGRM